MSLKHAILGFLAEQPRTGYDLKGCFDTSVSYFWHADQAQIYRTLDTLTEDGFVQFQVEIQDDRPNRKIYTITPTGREELRRWLQTLQPEQIRREPFLVQVFFGDPLSNDELIHFMEQKIKAHEAQLAEYNGYDFPPLTAPDLPRNARLQLLTLDFGKRYEQLHIDWLTMCIAQLRGLED